MKKEIYKVGDIVYYYDLERGCLKGEVIEIDNADRHSISVKLENNDERSFTIDGCYISRQLPRLSFAPYDIVNGGFTQERPLPKIEMDTLVYVKMYYNRSWRMAYFSHFADSDMYVFWNQKKSTETTDTQPCIEYSLTNPLE